MPKSIYHIPRMHGPHGVFASPFGSSSEPTVHYHHGVVCQERNSNGECVHYYAPGLHYRGGEVIKEPKLYLIFYGSNWNTLEEDTKWKGALLNTLRGMTTEYAFDETYQRILHQYYDDQTEPHQISNTMTVAGEWTYEGAPAPQNITEENVELAVNQAIETNHWPREKNAIFMLMEPKGSAWTEAFAKKTECGYHFVDRWSDVYALIPNDNDFHFNSGCVVGTNQRAETETATHEYMEAVTDPHPQEGSTPGWNNSEGYEIADLCDEQPELLNETLSIWVSAVWGNAEKTCVIHDPPEAGPSTPTVTTEGATNITAESAVVHGLINPNGPATTYHVQYGFTTAYEYSEPYPEASAGFGTTPVPVSIQLSYLDPGFVYHYRLVATSFAGTSYGADQTFKALPRAPQAVINVADNLGPTIATLHGEVDPHGAITYAYFEYGTTTGYGSRTAEQYAGQSESPVLEKVQQAIEGLAPNTVYHYRLVAHNEGGTTYSSDETLTTTVSPYAVSNFPSNINLTEATLHGTVNAGGDSTTYQFEYWPAGHNTEVSYTPTAAESISASTAPVPVSKTINGLTQFAEYEYRIRATSSLGTNYGAILKVTMWPSFVIQPTPDPSNASERETTLRSVSCTSLTQCVAVGRSWNFKGGGFTPVEERWNGTEWAIESLPLPTGTKEAVYEAVSCTSATWCMMLGWYQSIEAGVNGPFTDIWNGSSWTEHTLAGVPVGRDLSCMSSTYCIALGSLAERWNGSEWTQLTVPPPPGAEGWHLESVSCSSASACTAVGEYAPNPSVWYAFAERWNGSEWTEQNVPNAEGSVTDSLTGVSCGSATQCVAVGTWKNAAKEKRLLTERWNGNSWTVVAVAPAAEETGTLSEISCVSSSACLAVGNYSGGMLLERWNGNAWAIQSPTAVTGGRLVGVSCSATSACTVVGMGEKGTGVKQGTLAENGAPGPVAEATAASSIKEKEVALNGVVNPEARETAYRFEIGKTIAYGTSLPVPEANAGSGTASVNVSQASSGLEPETTYHYRLVASNSDGITDSQDMTVTTAERPPVNLTVPVLSTTKPAQAVPLSTSNGTWSHNPTSYAYQWLQCNSFGETCLPISGASSSSYTPSAADVGYTLRAQVTATNVSGSTAAVSAASQAVLPPPPENTALPTISESHTSGWSAAHAIDTGHSFAGASCPSTGFCVAVDNAGNILTTTNSGSTWSTTAISGAPVFTAVSCSPGTTSTSGLCMAVTNGQTAYLANNPAGGAGSWTSTTTYTAGGHLSVSCATTSFCISTTSGQTNIAAVSGTTATWTDSGANASEFKSDSCMSTTFCLHVDSGNGIDYSTKPTEAAGWGTFVATGFTGNSVSCAPGTTSTSGLCVDVGASGTISTATNPSGTWTTANIDGTNTLTSISCASTTFCTAVDNNGNVLTSTTPTSAASWVKTDIDSTYTINSVSCPSASFCAAVDNQGRALVSSNPTGGAGSWKLEAGDPGASLTGVSCTSSTFCAAVDNVGHILAYTGSTASTLAATAGNWTNEPTSYAYQWQRCNTAGGECINITGATNTTYALTSADIGHTIRVVVIATNSGGSNSATSAATSVIEGLKHTTQTIDSGTSLNAASCIPATSDCIVSDGKGNALYTTNASATSAASWSAWTGPSSSASEAVACPITSLCTLADGGSVYWSSSLGGPWTLAFTPSYHVIALTCPASSFCIDGQGENGGYIRYSTNPSSTSWNAELIGGAVTMNGVFCLSSSFCTAVDSAGNLHVATSTAQIESASWTNTDVNGTAALTGISCTSTTSCVAVDGTGDIVNLAINGTGAATATKHNVDGANSFTAVACTTNSTCAAVDNQGNVFVSNNGGETWTKEYQLGADLTGVSCASASLCVTVDTTGDVTTFEA